MEAPLRKWVLALSENVGEIAEGQEKEAKVQRWLSPRSIPPQALPIPVKIWKIPYKIYFGKKQSLPHSEKVSALSLVLSSQTHIWPTVNQLIVSTMDFDQWVNEVKQVH